MNKNRIFGVMILSVILHLSVLTLMVRTGIFILASPVTTRGAHEVDLTEQERDSVSTNAPLASGPKVTTAQVDSAAPTSEDDAHVNPAAAEQPGATGAVDAAVLRDPPREGAATLVTAQDEPAKIETAVTQPNSQPNSQPAALTATIPTRPVKLRLPPPLRKGDEFLATVSERLTYRLSLHGAPVGQASLSAQKRDAGVRISLHIVSHPILSAIYPVDDEVESELVAGNYIVTRIRQREGEFQRHSGFTLMLREKKAFSADRLRGGFVTEPLPRDDVTDIISGLYLMRNRPVEVGKDLLLQVYDAQGYAPTRVEVLRRESIRVSGLGEVECLVLRPHLKSGGFFRSASSMLIWLSSDSFKVPLKVQVLTPLGEVTADLASSEVER